MRPFVFYMRCISRIKLLGSGGCPDTVLVAKLHLTFLVAAQHQRMLRRRHIQADDFLKLLNKFRIARYLERLDQVRLETIGLPDLEHRRIRNAKLGGQLARAPMRGTFRHRLRRYAYNLRRVDTRLTSATRPVRINRRHAAFGKSSSPCNDLIATNFEPPVNFHPNGAKTFSAYWSHWICGVMEPVVFHRNGATLFSA